VIIKRLGKPTEGWGKRKENWKEWEKWQRNPFVPAVLWELRLKRQDPALPPLKDDEWKKFCDALLSFGQRDAFGPPSPVGELIQAAPDLDGDGVRDLVFAFDRFVLAISGKEGKVRWCRELHSNVFVTQAKTWSLLTETEQQSLLALSLAQAILGVTAPVPPWL
jgi:hypothetical protein